MSESRRTVVLEQSRAVAILCSLILTGLLVGIAVECKDYLVDSVPGLASGAGYWIPIGLLLPLAVVLPIMTYIALRRDGRLVLSPTEIKLGKRRVAWTDVGDVGWDSHRGASWLVVRSKNGSALKMQPGLYDGGAEHVLTLLRKYLPEDVSSPALTRVD